MHTPTARDAAPWAALGAVILALESIAIRQDRRPLDDPPAIRIHTLSKVLRWLFRTNTPEGRIGFIGGWTLITCLFIPHIVREVVVDAVAEAVADADA